MNCRERLEGYLRDNGVSFETHRHPEGFTAQEVAAKDHVPGRMLVKVVMVLADQDLVMLATPAPYQVNLDRVGEVLGATEVRLASEEEFASAFPDCEVGAMPPFGNLYDLPVYVDEALAEDETIVVQSGTHTDTVRLRYADFERLVEPTAARFAYHA